jgi:hypothetical protein
LFLAAKQQRQGKLAESVHEPGSWRNIIKPRLVMQERESQAPGEQSVGGNLIADHASRPGKVSIGFRAQRLGGGGEVDHLDVASIRDDRGTAV